MALGRQNPLHEVRTILGAPDSIGQHGMQQDEMIATPWIVIVLQYPIIAFD